MALVCRKQTGPLYHWLRVMAPADRECREMAQESIIVDCISLASIRRNSFQFRLVRFHPSRALDSQETNTCTALRKGLGNSSRNLERFLRRLGCKLPVASALR